MGTPRPALAFLVAGLLAAPAGATDLWLQTAAGALEVPVRSMRELRFVETVPQQYDFSCGSAAVATLLSHHYGRKTGEIEVFLEMWKQGDRAKIRQEGFSLLDMKRYLDAHDFAADGFRIPAERISKAGVAGIVLLEHLDQPHFVVVSGERDGQILLNDPARGIWSLPIGELEELWNGIFFVVRGRASLARSNFNDGDVWRWRRWAPVSTANLAELVPTEPRNLPEPFEILVDP